MLDSNSMATAKPRCDVCQHRDGYSNLSFLLQCTTCGVNVHKECYGIATEEKNFECYACQSVGKNFQIELFSGDGRRVSVMQVSRPEQCDLCSISKGIHAMHPIFDNRRQDHRSDSQLRLVWAHTLCCRVLASKGLLIACFADGSLSSKDDEDSNDDRSVNPELSEVSKSKGHINIHHYQYFQYIGNARGQQKDCFRRILDHQVKFKCTVCDQDDKTFGVSRVPILCAGNHPDEPSEFSIQHKDKIRCSSAAHVGCARWGSKNKHGVQRMYYFPGTKDIPELGCLFCTKHGKDVDKKYQKKILEADKTNTTTGTEANNLAHMISQISAKPPAMASRASDSDVATESTRDSLKKLNAATRRTSTSSTSSITNSNKVATAGTGSPESHREAKDVSAGIWGDPLSSPNIARATHNNPNDSMGQALWDPSPSSSRVTQKNLQKRKVIDMSPIPSLEKLCPKKKAKKVVNPPPADSAAPVTKIVRRKLGKTKTKAKKKTVDGNEEVVSELAKALIKECMPIKDGTQRSRRRSELKREWKRKHLHLNSDAFNKLWTSARAMLNQAIKDDQEAIEDFDILETRVPANVSNVDTMRDEEARGSGKDQAEQRVQEFPLNSTSKVDKEGANSTLSVEANEADEEPNVEIEEATQPENTDVPVVDEFEGAGENRWTDLFVGLKFEGKKYLFTEWDSCRVQL